MKNIALLSLLMISLSYCFVSCTNSKNINSNNLLPAKSASKQTISSFNRNVMLKKVNEARSKARTCGNKRMQAAKPLVWNNVLHNVAEVHSLDMSKNNFVSHTSKTNGSTPDSRVKKAGYRFLSLSENIAFGYPSVDLVVESWLESKLHCENIMKPEVTEIGVDVKNNYWTMVLAKPKSR